VMRPAEDLIAFWALSDPGRLRHVCRPTRPQPGAPVPCFSTRVGPASLFGIALAAPELAPAAPDRPIRPRTPAWDALLAGAGVKAA